MEADAPAAVCERLVQPPPQPRVLANVDGQDPRTRAARPREEIQRAAVIGADLQHASRPLSAHPADELDDLRPHLRWRTNVEPICVPKAASTASADVAAAAAARRSAR